MDAQSFSEAFPLVYSKLFKALEAEYFKENEIEDMLATAVYTISGDTLTVEYNEGTKDFFLISGGSGLKFIDKVWGP